MCRYAFSGPYREPYACFSCRKSFHVAMNWDGTREPDAVFPCPECKQPMHSMGLDFEAPRQRDIQQWRKVKLLYENGFTYHTCGCGAGHRPKRLSEVPAFLQEKAHQREQAAAWNRRAAELGVKEANRKERERRKPKKVQWEFYPTS